MAKLAGMTFLPIAPYLFLSRDMPTVNMPGCGLYQLVLESDLSGPALTCQRPTGSLFNRQLRISVAFPRVIKNSKHRLCNGLRSGKQRLSNQKSRAYLRRK
jgi:hypothetical protein